MKPNEFHILVEKILADAVEQKKLSKEEAELHLNKINSIEDPIIKNVVDSLYKSLCHDIPSMLKAHHKSLEGFEKRHYKLWSEGLDLLEAFLVSSYELGENFNSFYRDEAVKDQDYLFDVLTKLHARSIGVGTEVLCLIKSGFADGAHARWRTAHEINVVAKFLSLHGQNVAQRYLEHEIIESYKALTQFQKYATTIGEVEFSEEEVIKAKTNYDTLSTKYGKPFTTQYGWAAKALSNPNPTFSAIEKKVGLNMFRPYYKMASYNVHANSKGICTRLSVPECSEMLLTGPSNYGLLDPAQGISTSVLQTTLTLLNLKPNIDALVMQGILNKFVENISAKFNEIHQYMANEDKARKQKESGSN
jgi:Family of unknown function (DUF5677)